jgi:hypothetical protein
MDYLYLDKPTPEQAAQIVVLSQKLKDILKDKNISIVLAKHPTIREPNIVLAQPLLHRPVRLRIGKVRNAKSDTRSEQGRQNS